MMSEEITTARSVEDDTLTTARSVEDDTFLGSYRRNHTS
jgi:hypothetical protein